MLQPQHHAVATAKPTARRKRPRSTLCSAVAAQVGAAPAGVPAAATGVGAVAAAAESEPPKKATVVRRPREKKPKVAARQSTWRPPPFDFIYNDTWDYEVNASKQRITLERPVGPAPPVTCCSSSLSLTSSCSSSSSSSCADAEATPGEGGGREETPSKRRRKTPVASSVNPVVAVTRTTQLLLPSFLTRALWERHGYTINDIVDTLQSFKPFHLWHLAISERLTLTKLAVQPSYASQDSFVFGAKAIVIDHLKIWIEATYVPPPGNQNVLTNTEGSHVPPLPVHRVSAAEFGLYAALLPKEPTATGALPGLMEPTVYANITTVTPPQWRGIYVVPIEIERGGNLLLSRVLPSAEYYAKFGIPTCLTMTPLTVRLANGSKWCIMDESFHLVHQSTP